ncbi:Fc.00g110410.m01.CDS01 [Cosmosporella sp. VM-42]
MAALVQTYPQQTGTVTMLQTRPNSTAIMIPTNQGQAGHQYMGGQSQAPRSPYAAPPGYRGSAAPVQPYAFTSTPNLNQNQQAWQSYGQYQAPTQARNYNPNVNYRPQHSASMTNLVQNPMGGQIGSRDDSSIPPARNIVPAPRPQSAYLPGSSQQSFTAPTTTSNKAAPDRYRRTVNTQQNQQNVHGRSQSSVLPGNNGIPTATQLYNGPNPQQAAVPNRPNSFYNVVPGSSADDMQLYGPGGDAKRARRRSVHSINSDSSSKLKSQDKSKLGATAASVKVADKDSKTLRVVANPPSRNGSSESIVSSRSSHSRPTSSANRNVSVPTGNPSSLVSDETSSKQDHAKLVNIPPRGSSSDAIKRTINPSPLSRPATMANDVTDDAPPSTHRQTYAQAAASNLETPAARQLAAIQKGGKAKSKTSRLRRAFSFGSAADFRKAAQEHENPDKSEPSKLHKDPTPDEAYDAEQARIAEQQEAAGLGHSIYGGRFNFSGSTDNLSISSTASSASIMIRKMGRGMKKSTRSLVGLFRPKSVIGVPPADGPVPEASQAEVSMVTAEAETQRVNVTAQPNPTDTFPHLERNSIDTSLGDITERLGSSGTDNSNSRKSIVGGDRERAEVLAAVRKGILKRPGSASPSIRPADASPGLDLPGVPAISDSPNSSAPSTPNDEAQGHRRTGSIAIGSEDYFMTALRLRQDTKSAPSTPHGSKRNATFSPRIVFYDTWPSQEYDRRGEVATCNRLTPMLAQQIKEELNTFKMEMEVHENSKIYTHFF